MAIISNDKCTATCSHLTLYFSTNRLNTMFHDTMVDFVNSNFIACKSVFKLKLSIQSKMLQNSREILDKRDQVQYKKTSTPRTILNRLR